MQDEMSRACRIHGRDRERIQQSGGKARRKETTRKNEM
jgi:hypothetical protein